jgi:hypothetical protein
MKAILMILGAILMAMGLVWILQGLGVLTAIPSFMVGRMVWTWYGAACMVVGAVVILWARRRAR